MEPEFPNLSLGNPEGLVACELGTMLLSCRAYANLVAKTEDTVGIRLILNKSAGEQVHNSVMALIILHRQAALNPGALKGRSG